MIINRIYDKSQSINSYFEGDYLAKMFAAERRKIILGHLQQNQRATVNELSQILGVSEATLRTDLTKIEDEGLITRTHGGAMLIEEIRSEYSFTEREKKNKSLKMEICAKAVELIQDGECILLDASTTGLELARILKHKHIQLTVVTNCIYSAMELKENPGITVILMGGVLRIGSVAIEGVLGANILNKINVNTMFTSASGFTIEEGLTGFSVYEVELKKAMVNAASKVVAMLDSTKIGRSSIAPFAKTSELDTLITNRGISPDILDQLKSKQINVILV